jgi:ABC-type branched-subunit amino acid transport system ATPase component
VKHERRSVIDEGRIAAQVSTEQLRADADLRRAYLGV